MDLVRRDVSASVRLGTPMVQIHPPAQLLMSPVPPSDPDSVQTCRLRRVWCPAACVCRLELQMKVPEDFTITEKVPTRAFSWLKVPTNTLTLKTLCETGIDPW